MLKTIAAVPPAVADLIAKLSDGKLPGWNRDNIASTLGGIQKACDDAIKAYLQEKQRADSARSKKKARAR